MIDSNDRTADSASTSDFTVNLPSQLLINDDHGIQLKSLYVPNTLKTINTGINDKLYTSLNDGTSTAYHTLTFPAISYDNVATLAADLQAGLSTVYFAPIGSITGAEGTWNNAGSVTLVSGFTYTNGNNFYEFTEWDAAAETGQMRRPHTNNNTEM